MVNRLGAALLMIASLNFLTNTSSTAAPKSSADHILIAKKNKGSTWATSMNDALSRAQQEHKLVFVDIGAPW
jgi:ABC-type sugar transport system substrate-binding protein